MTVRVREDTFRYETLIHRCSELITIVVNSKGTIVGYQDSSHHTITVCPHCFKDIEYEDLQNPGMVTILGWPD